MKVGILALQGNYDAHEKRLAELDAEPILVRKTSELKDIAGLVIPGGESSTMLRLMDDIFFHHLQNALEEGLPVLGTCAGLILLAKKVEHPKQRSFGVVDIDVTRNAYGRQLDSFIDDSMHWTDKGNEVLDSLNGGNSASNSLEGVFIRAPKITRLGEEVEVLGTQGEDPVVIREKKAIGATFHPELSTTGHAIHQLFLKML